MKKTNKKIALIMASVLVTSSMVVSSSAAFITYGASCNGNNTSWNTGCTSGNAQGSNCLPGSDLNSMLGGLYSSCTNPQNSGAPCNTDAANASSGNCQSIQSYLDAAQQKAACSTNNTEGYCGDTTAEETAAAPETTQTATDYNSANTATAADEAASRATPDSSAVAAAEETITAAETAQAVSTDTAGTATPDSQTSSCDTSVTFSDFSLNTTNKLFACLNSMLEKCGINLCKFGFNLPESSDTATQEPTAPVEDAAEVTTTPPVETTPVPEDSGTGAATTQTADNLSYEEQVAVLVNEQRAANGLAPLTLNYALSNVARAKSQDMHDNNYFSHTSPTYGSPFDMITSFGISYRAAGENIAMGYATPEAVVNAWMNSPGHRANILNASFQQIGVGYVADGNYWTQEFIG